MYRFSWLRLIVLVFITTSTAVGCSWDTASNKASSDETDKDKFAVGAIFVEAGDDLTRRIQTALINAQTGDTIVLPKGTFDIESTLTFDGDADGDQVYADNVTITGYGMDQTILNFENSNSGDGIFVQNARNIIIQDLSVREAANNGIKLKDSNGIILRRVSAIWEGVLDQYNGAYGLYPVECKNILIEDTYVRGSADAGIYVGQSDFIVVRRSKAEENVAGIEIENSKYADVYDNEAVGNTGGILIFDLPINNHRYGTSVRVFNNIVRNNNTKNFANSSDNPAGVHITPPGTGIIILSTDDVEVFNNTITGHDTSSILISSFFIAEQDIELFINSYGLPGQSIEDGWRPVPRNIHVHHNTITDNGGNPNGSLILDIIALYEDKFPGENMPAILYDGLGEGLANDGITKALGLVEEPFAEDGSDNVCANNNNASIAQLFVTHGINFEVPDTLLELEQDKLINCELISLPVHTVKFGNQIIGCGVDDDTEACQGGNSIGDSSTTDDTTGGFSGDGDLSLCVVDIENEVNWKAVDGANCSNLSSYNFFADAKNPAGEVNSNGLPYDLNSPLFTDYASKYRVVFVPDNEQAQYQSKESFDFPVGSVLVKTFALPSDTSVTGIQNEELIETRLLIHREQGWTALPYVWNGDKSDAILSKAGAILDRQVTHNGKTMDFAYVVPKVTDCKQCHQLQIEEESNAVFSPIGPKARHLNKTYTYSSGAMNQLTAWQDAGILSGLPQDLTSIDTVAAFDVADSRSVTGLSDVQLNLLAKGYLDINCSHCHRPEGNASNTGLNLEAWRPYEDGGQGFHGVCKKPVAYGGGSLAYDVVPGQPDDSILHFRMASDKPGDRMPEIGRSLVHQEGVALIHEWIKRLPAASCSD